MLCWSASAFNQQMADGEHCDCEHASFRNSLVEMQNLVLIYSMASLLNQGKRVGLEMTCRLTRCNWIPFIIALFEIQFVRPMNAFLSVPDIDGCPWSHIFERNLKIRMYVCPDNRCRKLKLENKLFFFKLFFFSLFWFQPHSQRPKKILYTFGENDVCRLLSSLSSAQRPLREQYLQAACSCWPASSCAQAEFSPTTPIMKIKTCGRGPSRYQRLHYAKHTRGAGGRRCTTQTQ